LTVASFAITTQCRPLVFVDAVGRERRELEKGLQRIGEAIDPLARGHLPALAVALGRFRAAAFAHARQTSAQIGDEAAHPFGVRAKIIGISIDTRFEEFHCARLRGSV
jgi:hypothetical protein